MNGDNNQESNKDSKEKNMNLYNNSYVGHKKIMVQKPQISNSDSLPSNKDSSESE
jgi:hypothetical protein